MNVISIGSESCEDLLLKKLGELVVVSRLANNLGKLVGNDEVNVDNAALYVEVNVISDELSNRSDLIVSSACLKSKNKRLVTEIGIKIKLARNLHLVVRHLCDLCRSGKESKNHCNECFEIKLHLVLIGVENVVVDRYAVDGIEHEHYKLCLANISDEGVNVNLSHKSCLSSILISLARIIESGSEVVKLEVDRAVVDYDLNVAIDVILNGEAVLLLLNLLLYLITNVVVKDSLNAGLGSVVAELLGSEGLELSLERGSLRLNVSLNLLVSKIKDRVGNFDVFTKKPSLVIIDILLNLTVLDLCNNAIVDSVAHVVKGKLSDEHYLFLAEIFDIPCK